MKPVVRQFGLVIGVVSLVGVLGCEAPRAERMRLVIPAYEATPGVELILEVDGASEIRPAKLRRPLGNVVYLAVRACEGLDSTEGRRRRLKLDFAVEQGEVLEASSRMPGRGNLSKEVRACLNEQINQGGSISRSGKKLAERRLDVSARVSISPE